MTIQDRKTDLLIEAEVNLRVKGLEFLQKITVKNLTRTWLWDYSDRQSQEIAAVVYWLMDTFGNNLEWYEIVCIVSSPDKSKG